MKQTLDKQPIYGFNMCLFHFNQGVKSESYQLLGDRSTPKNHSHKEGFLKSGYPQSSHQAYFRGIFHDQPSSYWVPP